MEVKKIVGGGNSGLVEAISVPIDLFMRGEPGVPESVTGEYVSPVATHVVEPGSACHYDPDADYFACGEFRRNLLKRSGGRNGH